MSICQPRWCVVLPFLNQSGWNIIENSGTETIWNSGTKIIWNCGTGTQIIGYYDGTEFWDCSNYRNYLVLWYLQKLLRIVVQKFWNLLVLFGPIANKDKEVPVHVLLQVSSELLSLFVMWKELSGALSSRLPLYSKPLSGFFRARFYADCWRCMISVAPSIYLGLLCHKLKFRLNSRVSPFVWRWWMAVHLHLGSAWWLVPVWMDLLTLPATSVICAILCVFLCDVSVQVFG